MAEAPFVVATKTCIIMGSNDVSDALPSPGNILHKSALDSDIINLSESSFSPPSVTQLCLLSTSPFRNKHSNTDSNALAAQLEEQPCQKLRLQAGMRGYLWYLSHRGRGNREVAMMFVE
jgi:hypothetical protein